MADMTAEQEAALITAGLSAIASLAPQAFDLFKQIASKQRPDLFADPPDAPTADESAKADAAAVAAKFGEGA